MDGKRWKWPPRRRRIRRNPAAAAVVAAAAVAVVGHVEPLLGVGRGRSLRAAARFSELPVHLDTDPRHHSGSDGVKWTAISAAGAVAVAAAADAEEPEGVVETEWKGGRRWWR